MIDKFKFQPSTEDSSNCTERKICFSILLDGFVVSWGNKYWVESPVNDTKVILAKNFIPLANGPIVI